MWLRKRALSSRHVGLHKASSLTALLPAHYRGPLLSFSEAWSLGVWVSRASPEILLPS